MKRVGSEYQSYSRPRVDEVEYLVPLCAICDHKIPYGTMNTDIQNDHPRFGQSTMKAAAAGRVV